jgi:hypothetical protein
MALRDGLRPRIAGSLFHLGMEHSVGIAVLIDAKLLASALALYRSQLEAYVRGAWILNCATEQQVIDFANDLKDAIPDFTSLTNAVDKKMSTTGLTRIRKAQWKILNDFAHGGAIQVGQRIRTSVMHSDYDDETALAFFKASTNLAGLTASGLMLAMGRENLALAMDKQFEYCFPVGWSGK